MNPQYKCLSSNMKYLLLLCCFFVISQNVLAQIDTVIICNAGDPAQLNAPTGNFAYQWTPRTNLDNPTIANPIATPTEPMTYVVRRISTDIGENLIQNPDFSEGNEGFESEYTFVERINTQGVYGIDVSAANLNPVFFTGCPDHTTGDGNMMIVDGSPTPSEQVWCQTITVTPNTDYAFSAWLTSVNRENPALLQFSINSRLIGEQFNAGRRTCDWRQFYAIWNAQNDTIAEICIVNRNTNPAGNDFALDDFAFYELDAVLFDTTAVLIEAIEAASERRVFFPSAFSPNFDSINDLFMPFTGKGVVRIEQLQIFDRWGNILFEAADCPPNETSCAWNGMSNDRMLQTGIYVYHATIEFADGNTETYTGELWLQQ